MSRLSYVLFEGFFMLAIHDEFIFHNGAIHQADARLQVKFTCQDDVMNLHCQSPRAIKIYKAEYSRRQNNICNRGKSAQYCDPVDKMSLVRKFCEGRMKCNVSVDKNTMGDECPTVFKYLSVLYECKTLPPSTEPPYERTKSTTVLTRPSTPYQTLSESTGNSTKPVVSYSSPSKRTEESTSVVHGFVFYNGESIHTISSALVALIMALEIFL